MMEAVGMWSTVKCPVKKLLAGGGLYFYYPRAVNGFCIGCLQSGRCPHIHRLFLSDCPC